MIKLKKDMVENKRSYENVEKKSLKKVKICIGVKKVIVDEKIIYNRIEKKVIVEK